MIGVAGVLFRLKQIQAQPTRNTHQIQNPHRNGEQIQIIVTTAILLPVFGEHRKTSSEVGNGGKHPHEARESIGVQDYSAAIDVEPLCTHSCNGGCENNGDEY